MDNKEKTSIRSWLSKPLRELFPRRLLNRRYSGRFRMTSAQIIPAAFLFLILAGALCLHMPIASAAGKHTTFQTALFTSTTSVCVTGSVVVDTYSHWSLFGKIVILFLIQAGGLGIIAVISLLFFIKRHGLSLGESLLLRDAYNLDSAQNISRFLRKVVNGTLIVELVGMIGYLPAFIHRYGFVRGFWYALFTSVSAFCNAGIDIMGPDSLTQFKGNPLVLTVTMALIIFGGIGYVVWFDVLAKGENMLFHALHRKKDFHRLSEHTRLVLILTAVCILGGALGVFLLEYRNPGTLGDMNLSQKILNSLFESVTFRTAGFSTFPQENLKETTAVFGILLMFTGGSPVGTAGGVKTVTMFVLLVNVMAFIQNKHEVIILNRRIPSGVIRKAVAIITVHFCIAWILCLCLMMATGLPFVDAMFEIMSAVSTVGLSRGVTAGLNSIGRWIVILAMYLGRIGPISMLLFFNVHPSSGSGVRHADGNYIVG